MEKTKMVNIIVATLNEFMTLSVYVGNLNILIENTGVLIQLRVGLVKNNQSTQRKL